MKSSIKRILTCLLCLLLPTGLLPQRALAATSWPSQVSIAAEGGIVMDADSGTVLYGKNIHLPYYPASITKILTALVVIEHCDPDDIVTYSHNAVYNVEAGSSSAGIDEGDQLSVRDSLYAMMLKSANEAANGLAEHTAGSIEAFAQMMNEKAAALGCTDSHFSNPSGLNDPNHYTTAYDMALIAQAAFQNETFVEIDSTLYYDIPPTKKNPEGIRVYPGHKMLKKNTSQYYPGIIGGKTGYTSLAGNTLVTCAARDGMTLIAVVLNGHQTHYTDTKALLDFGFGNFCSVNAAEYDSTYTSVENDMRIAGLPTTNLSILQIQRDCRVTLPVNTSLSEATSQITYELPAGAPENAVAQISYSFGDRSIGTTYLLRNEAATAPETTIADITAAEAAQPNGAALTADRDDPAAEGLTADADGHGARERTADAGDRPKNADGQADNRMANADGQADGADNGGADSRMTDNGAGGSADADTDGKPRFRLNIPPFVWTVFGILLGAAAVIGLGIMLKIRIEKREEDERLARYQRRQQRLQDIGMSSAEFDLLMQEKRTAASSGIVKKNRRSKHHKSFLDKKKF